MEPILANLASFADGDPTVRLLRSVVGFDGVTKCLVGGIVRDLALGRSPGQLEDLDFVFGPKGRFLVREAAKRLRARAARLENKEDETWRILAGDGLILDFTILPEGVTVERNLAGRDFAINAMAYDLDRRLLLDPTGGLADLSARRFRALPGAFAADPLRILRGARFVATFPGFRLDPETEAEARAQSPRLAGIPGERVREELLKLFRGDAVEAGLAALETTGAAAALFGDLTPAPGEEGLADAAAAARAYRAPAPEGLEPADPAAPAMAFLVDWLLRPAPADGTGAPHGNARLAGLCALLERLRFSNREVALARRLAEAALDLIRLAGAASPPPDWRLVDLVNLLRGDARFAALLVERSGARAGDATLASAAGALHEALRLGRGLDLPRLLDGRDLLSMGVAEGPEMGRLLSLVRRGQLEGRVASRSDACRLVVEQLGGGGMADADPERNAGRG